MRKHTVVLYLDFVEVIHVELPDKGGVVAVAKVLGKNLVLQLANIFNFEASALLLPLDDVGMLVELSQNGVTWSIWKSLDTKRGIEESSISVIQ